MEESIGLQKLQWLTNSHDLNPIENLSSRDDLSTKSGSNVGTCQYSMEKHTSRDSKLFSFFDAKSNAGCGGTQGGRTRW
jgi:hypothetical protein